MQEVRRRIIALALPFQAVSEKVLAQHVDAARKLPLGERLYDERVLPAGDRRGGQRVFVLLLVGIFEGAQCF